MSMNGVCPRVYLGSHCGWYSHSHVETVRLAHPPEPSLRADP